MEIKAKENCCHQIKIFSTDNSVDVFPVTDIAMVNFVDTNLCILWRN